MAQRSSARAWGFVAGIVVVIAVIASLYMGGGKPSLTEALDSTRSQDPHDEIMMMEQMWKEHPNHAPIALQLGNLYAEQGEHVKAIQYYREFLKLDTSSTGWEVRLDVAKSLYALNNPAGAKAELQWILDRQPDHAGALYNMGAIEANTGQPGLAKLHWEKLIATHPQDSLAQFAQQSLTKLN